MLKLILLGLVSAAASLDYETVPGLNYDTWWGPPGNEVDDPRILDFKIEFKKEVVEDLKARLEHTREFVPSMDGVDYHYGVNTHTFGYWLEYWLHKYNFTEGEAYLNKYPHKKIMVQGLWIHYIHIKPEVPSNKTVVPVLMLHGFPGSIREFYGTIPCIASDCGHRNYTVELIIPSLIGFGFSDYTNKTGLGAAEMACLFRKLMHKLGHQKFYAHGGDWGAHIADFMSVLFQDDVLGYHTNLGLVMTNSALSIVAAGSVYPEAMVPKNLLSRLYPIENTLQFLAQEFGYFHMQATKPDTIGIALSDSPAALLAWFFQLFSIASRRTNIDDPRGGLDLYTPEQLLDNAMIYWITNKGTTAMRIYAETANMRNYEMDLLNQQTEVPTVVVQAKDELYYLPPAVLNERYTNLLSVDVLDCCGHFLALEAPELFCDLFHSGLQKLIDFNEKKKCQANYNYTDS